MYGPAIAVGVGEEDESPPGEVLDVARIHTPLDELGTGRLGVVDHYGRGDRPHCPQSHGGVAPQPAG